MQHLFHVGLVQWTTTDKAQGYSALCDRVMHNTLVLRRHSVRPHRLQLEAALDDLNHLLGALPVFGPGPVPVSTTF